MELKVKGKFVTSSKVKDFQNPSCHILEKMNKSYDKKYIFGYHDALKSFPPSEGSVKSPSAPSVLDLYD